MKPLSLTSLNTLDPEAFCAALSDIYEHSPWVAERAQAHQPFASTEALAGLMARAVDNASRDEQLALINAHPDLASKWNSVESLTAFSAHEQQRSGLTDIDHETFLRFQELNRRHKERFSFPFIICVSENSLHDILEAFESRLKHDAETEFWAAITQIHRIAWYRLRARIAS